MREKIGTNIYLRPLLSSFSYFHCVSKVQKLHRHLQVKLITYCIIIFLQLPTTMQVVKGNFHMVMVALKQWWVKLCTQETGVKVTLSLVNCPATVRNYSVPFKRLQSENWSSVFTSSSMKSENNYLCLCESSLTVILRPRVIFHTW